MLGAIVLVALATCSCKVNPCTNILLWHVWLSKPFCTTESAFSQQQISPIGFLFWNFRHRLVRYYWHSIFPCSIGNTSSFRVHVPVSYMSWSRTVPAMSLLRSQTSSEGSAIAIFHQLWGLGVFEPIKNQLRGEWQVIGDSVGLFFAVPNLRIFSIAIDWRLTELNWKVKQQTSNNQNTYRT